MPQKINSRFYPIIILALFMFTPLFVFQQLGPLDFWWWMSTNLVIVISLGLVSDKAYRSEIRSDFSSGLLQKLFIGLASALILYLVFYAGNQLIRILFDFAERDISNVYRFKGDASALKIGLLMLFIIGPGEELFWRAYIQGNMMKKFGKQTGFLISVIIYTGIHFATGNFVLILAALTGGIFWGWMYMRYRSITANIISHIVWDISVFLLFPF
ncbi:MAG: type II CAAX endopeptidase family protein [Bacteroidales bacterium]